MAKTTHIQIRVSEERKRALQDRADAAGTNLSDYMLAAAEAGEADRELELRRALQEIETMAKRAARKR